MLRRILPVAGLVALCACADELPSDPGSPSLDLNPSPPAAPTALTAAIVSFDHVDLSWNDASADESVFRVWRRQDPGSGWEAWSHLVNVPANGTAWSDTTVDRGFRYQFRIRACAVGECSAMAYSNVVVTDSFPSAPSDVDATGDSAQVGVWWTDAFGESSYEIGRRGRTGSDPYGPWQSVGSVAGNVTHFSDTTVTRGDRYRYRVRACSIAGCSAWSMMPGSALAQSPPVAPSFGSYEANNKYAYWTEVPHASYYLVQRYEWDAFDVVVAGWTGIGRFDLADDADPNPAFFGIHDLAVTKHHRYRYRARACNPTGCSGWFIVGEGVVP